MDNPDVTIIGAGAAGLMCAIEAGKRGRKVVVLDHTNKAGKKILMSGGGRCNFTNYSVSAENYLCHNPHFVKSALSRYTQWDFIALVEQYAIPYHEREHGQLFCDDSAKDILNMLLSECRNVGVQIVLNCQIDSVSQKGDNAFQLGTSRGIYQSASLVIATGGLSIPKMSASPFGYRIAEQFGLAVRPTRAGLVPFTLHEQDKQRFAPLSGIAVDAVVSNDQMTFRENLLFTHRGLSGPVILQISSWWQAGETVRINFLPDHDLLNDLERQKQSHPQQQLKTALSQWLPKRLVTALIDSSLANTPLQGLSHQQLEQVQRQIQAWQLLPNGTEGYRTAEVTVGGVDVDELSSKTMQSKKISGLYFVGEVVDVTGWLGGYNFQWAWASGWCAGQVV